MRRLWILLALVLAASPVGAQMLGVNPQNVTAGDSGTACVTVPGACASFPVNISTSVAFDIGGTFSGTLTFEATTNGGNWRSILVTNAATGAKASTTTAAGSFAVPNAGFVGVRVRMTSYSSGTAIVTATQGYATANTSTPTFPSSFTAGDLLYANTATTVSGIADVAVNQVLVSSGVGAAPAYSANPTATTFTATNTALGTTSTNGFIAQNTTAATGGVTVQISPRSLWRGTAWDTAASQTVDFFAEVLPTSAATPSGTWKLGYSLNGAGASYPVQIASTGEVIIGAGAISGIAGGSLDLANTAAVYWNGRGVLKSPGGSQFTLGSNSAGVLVDGATDGTLKLRNFAGTSATGILDVGGAYQLNGVAGIGLAVAQALPADQTGNATATLKMNGLGAAAAPCTITPTSTGRVLFIISGDLTNSTILDGIAYKLVYGTGAAPANAAAATGTAVSALRGPAVPVAAQKQGFSVQGIATGLSLVATWFDLQVADVTGGTASISNVTCSAHEM